jgi:hypothetical protein
MEYWVIDIDTRPGGKIPCAKRAVRSLTNIALEVNHRNWYLQYIKELNTHETLLAYGTIKLMRRSRLPILAESLESASLHCPTLGFKHHLENTP